MIGFLIGLLLIGLIAGFIARAVVPGKDAMSIPATILLGVVGSFVGGFLTDVLFRNDAQDEGVGSTAGLFGSIVGAVIVLLVYNRVTGGRATRRGLRRR